MIKLPNNCSCSNLAVHPANWDKSEASTEFKWRITYRFYDWNNNVKQVSVKGMNHLQKLADRQTETAGIIEQVLINLHKGYNPITKEMPEEQEYEIDPDMPLYKALDLAYPKIKCIDKTKTCIKSMLNCSSDSAKKTGVHNLPVSQVKRRHIVRLLDQCKKDRDLSPGNYNHYRSYLRMMFKVLVKLEAIESNPVTEEVEKEEELKKIKKILNLEERQKVDAYLKEHHYNFWRYIHIFFHSGCRSTEMVKIQGRHVDLEEQVFTVTILKGEKREAVKAIKAVALPYWQDVMKGCGPDDYVFSENLSPGKTCVLAEMASRYWKTQIKGRDTSNSKAKKKRPSTPGIGISADWYALKHLASDETAKLLSIQHAQKQNDHRSESTTKIYAVNQNEREINDIKGLDNKFA